MSMRVRAKGRPDYVANSSKSISSAEAEGTNETTVKRKISDTPFPSEEKNNKKVSTPPQ